MREIKFRVWDYKNSNMDYDKPQHSMLTKSFAYTCKDAELMQYTGLKDKNGVEIYEGDIVKDLRSPFKDIRSYSKVFYQENRGRFVFGGWEIPAGLSHTFEVIGNIYENPELLHAKE